MKRSRQTYSFSRRQGLHWSNFSSTKLEELSADLRFCQIVWCFSSVIRARENHCSEVLSYPPRFIPLPHSRGHHKLDMKIIRQFLIGAYRDPEGQDVAEYAIMLAVVLVIVVGTVRMIGSNAGIVFSQVASGIQ